MTILHRYSPGLRFSF
uniref:Uncharacterized protein n=1 Tax=Anguilla anguilla TaxID=7936 RepID=A0A0E9XN78_ANGAN